RGGAFGRRRVRPRGGVPPPSQPSTKKNTGVRKTPKAVTPSIPQNTAVPSDRRISAPAAVASTSGKVAAALHDQPDQPGASRAGVVPVVGAWVGWARVSGDGGETACPAR